MNEAVQNTVLMTRLTCFFVLMNLLNPTSTIAMQQEAWFERYVGQDAAIVLKIVEPATVVGWLESRLRDVENDLSHLDVSLVESESDKADIDQYRDTLLDAIDRLDLLRTCSKITLILTSNEEQSYSISVVLAFKQWDDARAAKASFDELKESQNDRIEEQWEGEGPQSSARLARFLDVITVDLFPDQNDSTNVGNYLLISSDNDLSARIRSKTPLPLAKRLATTRPFLRFLELIKSEAHHGPVWASCFVVPGKLRSATGITQDTLWASFEYDELPGCGFVVSAKESRSTNANKSLVVRGYVQATQPASGIGASWGSGSQIDSVPRFTQDMLKCHIKSVHLYSYFSSLREIYDPAFGEGATDESLRQQHYPSIERLKLDFPNATYTTAYCTVRTGSGRYSTLFFERCTDRTLLESIVDKRIAFAKKESQSRGFEYREVTHDGVVIWLPVPLNFAGRVEEVEFEVLLDSTGKHTAYAWVDDWLVSGSAKCILAYCQAAGGTDIDVAYRDSLVSNEAKEWTDGTSSSSIAGLLLDVATEYRVRNQFVGQHIDSSFSGEQRVRLNASLETDDRISIPIRDKNDFEAMAEYVIASSVTRGLGSIRYSFNLIDREFEFAVETNINH